jgi:hypothetical protein
MKSRLLAAGVAALAALTLTPAHAATPTVIVYTGPTLMQVATDTELTASLEEQDTLGLVPGVRLRFTLGTASVEGRTAKPEEALVTGKLKPPAVGENLPLMISYAGSDDYEASSATVAVDVYEVVIQDALASGWLLMNPSRKQFRVLQGNYDSGLLTGVEFVSAGGAYAIDIDRTDANGDRLVLKGAAAPARGVFALAGAAGDEPILLAA